MFLGALVIYILAPIPSVKRSLDWIECKVYKRRALLTLFVEIIISYMLFFLGELLLAVIIQIAIIFVAISVIAGNRQKGI